MARNTMRFQRVRYSVLGLLSVGNGDKIKVISHDVIQSKYLKTWRLRGELV